METIGSVIIDLKADTQKLVTGFDKAEKTVSKSVNTMKKTIVSLAATYVSFQSINAFATTIKGSIDAADALAVLAEKLAISTESLSSLQYAASYADVSIGQLNASMSAMIRRTGNFTKDGTGAAAKAMKVLGISVEDARKEFTDTETTFKYLLNALSKVEDGTLRTKLAQDLFSKSAADVVRMANMGAKELDRLATQGKKTGAVISNEMAANAGKFNDELTEFGSLVTGVSNDIGTSLLPVLIQLAKRTKENTESLSTNKDLMQDFFISSVAGADTVIDVFNFLYEVVENSVQMAVFGLNTVVYGAFRTLTGYSLELSKALNSVGLSSDKTVSQMKATFESIDSQYKNAIEGLSKSHKEIEDSADKAAVSYTQRVINLKNEILLEEYKYEIQKKQNEETKKKNPVNGPDVSSNFYDKKDDTNEQSSLLAYYEMKEQYADAWAIKEANYATQYKDLTKSQLAEMLEYQKTEYFDKLKEEITELEDYEFKINVSTEGMDKAQKALVSMGTNIESIGKEQKSFNKYSEDYAKIVTPTQEQQAQFSKSESAHVTNQIEGYSALAGTMASMYEQGSSAANAMVIVQKSLSIISGVRAIAEAMANGDGYTAVARGLAVAATLASFGWSGSGGGASAPVESINVEDYNSDLVESATDGLNDDNDVIIEKFDRQIELLEALNKSGTASKVSAESTLVRFRADYNDFVAESLKDLELTRTYWLGPSAGVGARQRRETKLFGEFFRDKGLQVNESNANVDYTSGEGSELARVITLDPGQFLQNNMLFAELLADASNPIDGGGSIYKRLFGGAGGLSSVVGDFFEVFNESITGLLSTFQDMAGASDTLKNAYDSITGTTTYQTKDLLKSFNDVEKILGTSTLPQYLEQNIEALSSVAGLINDSTIELLRSEDIGLLDEKMKLLADLTSATGVVFENGAEDALNYLESIEAVSEVMATSRENIKTYLDKFKNNTELAEDMAKALGVDLATGLAELNDLFIQMSTDIEGLTNSELEFLEANKNLIDSTSKTALDNVTKLSTAFDNLGDSIEDTINTLLGNSDALDSQDQLISSFLTKQEEIDALLAKDGDLTTTESNRLSELVSDVNKLATSIQSSNQGDNSQITSEMVTELTSLKNELDFDNSILKVKIVASEIAFGFESSSTDKEIGVLTAINNIDGSHYNGLANVPFDGYIAQLHKNERVLTAEENQQYTTNNNDMGIIRNLETTQNILADGLTRVINELSEIRDIQERSA